MDLKAAGLCGNLGDRGRVSIEPGRAGTGGGLDGPDEPEGRGGETGGVAGRTCTAGLANPSGDDDEAA